LERFQKEMEEKDVTCSLQKEEIQLQSQYQRALKQEEELWQLKSRSL
jgi:CRISPR/Cas system CSM-associated protein Csm2 small subunit